MTETIAPVTALTADPMAAMAGPLRAAFTAAMAPYVSGDAAASTDLTGILTEAVTAADPTPELVGALCDLIASAAPTSTLLALMHEAVGVALGLTQTAPMARGARTPLPRQAAPVASRSGGLRERIAELFSQSSTTQWTVTELAHRLGNSSGAVGAALERMLSNGEAVLAATSPKRYAAPAQADATTTASPAEDATDNQPQSSDDEATAPEVAANEAPDEANGNSPAAENTDEADTQASTAATRRKNGKSADA